jgi:hypothetical protein
MLNKALIMLTFAALTASSFAATKLQKRMIRFVDSVADVYDSMYAPALWKKEFANWTLATEVAKAKEKILAKNLSLSEYQKVVTALILSMKDFHVSVRFHATERASLPFMVRGSEGRYFIVHIDKTKLSSADFPFAIGDELVEMNGKSVDTIVKELKATLGGNSPKTDQALAEMTLTSRSASRAHTVPQGPITLTFLKNGKKVSRQLIWEYTKETVSRNNISKTKSTDSEDNFVLMPKLEMTSQIALDFASEAKETNKFGLGKRTSYLPSLGTKIWESDKSYHHDAYIYLNSKKELIGYVRIPKYGAGEKESLEFKETIKRLQRTTDKLVIDQLNNPGGSVFYLYSLVSMLTDKPVAAPKHYMSINQKMVLDAQKSHRDLSKIQNIEELKKAIGSNTISGYPVSMTFLEFMKSYYQFITDEWNKGKTLTSPYHLYGVDKINPHPEVNYTKPILLLVNELDFSGGDFFPAIMQDNKRATIMGVRTSGAGGYVIGVEIPNQLGVNSFRYTGSLADRVDHTPIENLGVTPEIEYSLTPADFQKGFKPFKTKVQETINSL